MEKEVPPELLEELMDKAHRVYRDCQQKYENHPYMHNSQIINCETRIFIEFLQRYRDSPDLWKYNPSYFCLVVRKMERRMEANIMFNCVKGER